MSVLSDSRRYIIQLMVKHPATTQRGIESMIAAYETSVMEIAEVEATGTDPANYQDDIELLQQLFEVVVPHIEMEGFVRHVHFFKPGSFGIAGNDTIH